MKNNYLLIFFSEPPEITPFQFPENLREGNRAHITCTVVSGDLPIQIIWHKDGNPIPQDHDIQESNNQFVSSLTFSNLGARHSGHYTCIAKNAAAEANFTAKLVIRGEYNFPLIIRHVTIFIKIIIPNDNDNCN